MVFSIEDRCLKLASYFAFSLPPDSSDLDLVEIARRVVVENVIQRMSDAI